MMPRIFGRALALVSGRFLSDGMQLLLYVFVVRTFSEAEIGHYSFAFALALVVGQVVSMGVRSLITREVCNAPALGPRIPANMLLLHGALSVVAGLALATWCLLTGVSLEVTIMSAMASLSTSLMAVGYSAIAVVDASGAVHRGAQGEVIAKAIAVLIGFCALFAGLSLYAVIGSQVIGSVVYVVLAYRWIHHTYGLIEWKVDFALISRISKMALPFAGAALLYALYARVDIIMLHHLAGPEATGHYAVAFRFIETSMIVSTMVGIAIFPDLAGKQPSAQQRQLFTNAVRWLAVLGSIGSLALIVAGDQLTTFVFGASYELAGRLLMTMALLITISYVKESFWRLLVAQNREYLQLAMQGFTVTLNIVLNLILIPRFGAFGAVGASLISESLLLIGFVVVVHRQRWVVWSSVSTWLLVVILAVGLGFALRAQTWPIAAAGAAIVVLITGFLSTRLVTVSEISRLLLAVRAR